MYMCFYNSNRNQFAVDIDILDIGTVSLNPRSAYNLLLSESEKQPSRHGDMLTLKCLHANRFFQIRS